MFAGNPAEPPSRLPRNLWATSLASFLTDVSSEMVLNLLPLFLANALGVRTHVIGLIEGVAEATASLVKVFSGRLSDRWRARKWIAVAGYGLSALSKPLFYVADTWGAVAGVRWADRVGKGIRTAPRDALVADSIGEGRRGLAFGFQRAADTAGAMLGLLVALAVVWLSQRGAVALGAETFRVVVLISVLPALLGVLSLAVGARDVPVARPSGAPRLAFRCHRHRQGQGTERHQGHRQDRHDRRSDNACRGRDQLQAEEGLPGDLPSRRPYRRSGGARHGYDRRLDRQ